MMDVAMTVLIFVVILTYHGMLFRELQKARKEREELYNRLMAKDYREYALMSMEHHQKQKDGFIKRAIDRAYGSDETEA